MKTFDWIVVGGGLAGSALGYELTKVGCSVLLLQTTQPNATQFSYGGIAYWSGTTDFTHQICQEGIEIHRQLSAELEGDTEFQEVDLLLTIAPDRDPQSIARLYAACAMPPKLITADDACEIEPLLNRGAIGAALHSLHGHVSPTQTVLAYQQAMVRLGGKLQVGQVVTLLRQNRRVVGVATATEQYEGANVVICAGGMSRVLLRSANLPVRLYFTQAELVDLPASDLKLRAIVSPAELKRFEMEGKAGRIETDGLWDEPDHEVTSAIFDASAVQFRDGRVRMGQISRALTDPDAQVNTRQSEAEIRAGVEALLPTLQGLPGQWRSCLVSFSGDRLPLLGALPDADGIYIFSGFSNPFALLPPLARRFAQSQVGQADTVIAQLSPDRFAAVR